MTWRPSISWHGDGGPRATTLSGSLADAIADRIVSGVYPPGTQLRQDSLAKDLGASRIPVREALVQLESLGFVTKVPHKGAVVSAPSRAQIDQLFELRTLIECRLLELAVPELSDEDLDTAEAINREIIAFRPGRDDLREWARLNQKFHAALYRAAGRSVWLHVHEQLHAQTYRYRRTQLQQDSSNLPALAREHQQLLRHCRARDAARAVAVLREHIVGAHMQVMAHLTRAALAPDAAKASKPAAGSTRQSANPARRSGRPVRARTA